MPPYTIVRENLPPSFKNVTADSLAGLSGAIPSEYDSMEEGVKHTLALLQLGMLQDKPEHEADVVYSELAAKYLPALAERFIAHGELMNAPMVTLNTVTHTPYFIRFLTTPAGQNLAATQLRRIAECTDQYSSRQSHERIGEACQFAATLLVLQGHDNIPAEIKAAAISRLERWKAQHRGTFAEEAVDRCLGSLRSPGNFGSEMSLMIMGFKAALQGPLMMCGRTGCRRRVGDGQGEMMKCSRCKSTLYCSSACQQSAWRAHKPLCFATTF